MYLWWSLRTLYLHTCKVFRALINSLVCWFYFIENLVKVNVIAVLDRSTNVTRSQPRAKLSTPSRYVSGHLDCCPHPSLKQKQKTFYTHPIQFSSRWYVCARKSPYAFHPSLRSFPNVAFETVPMFVWLTMAPSRPVKEDRLALPLPTSLSSRRSMVWCSWLYMHIQANADPNKSQFTDSTETLFLLKSTELFTSR